MSILLCIYRAGTLVVPLPLWSIAILDCTRDTCTKRCILVYHGIYIYCLISTVLSETLLFLTLSWCILHLTLSPSTSIPGVCTGQGMIFLPEPGELPYGTALLLSYAGTGVGTVLVIQRCMVGVYYWSMVSSGVWAWAFTVLQVNEFHYLGVYSNDSYLGCTYISLSGLHSLHVLYGIAILGVSGNTIPPLHLTPTRVPSLTLVHHPYLLYLHLYTPNRDEQQYTTLHAPVPPLQYRHPLHSCILRVSSPGTACTPVQYYGGCLLHPTVSLLYRYPRGANLDYSLYTLNTYSPSTTRDTILDGTPGTTTRDTVSIDGYYTMDYSYWHIVEMVFILIYITPCYH